VSEGSRQAPRSPRRLASVFFADEQERPVEVERLRDLAGHVLSDQRVPPGMELNVLCVERDAMAELNLRHMGSDGPTDVLAFPMDAPGESVRGEPAILGDVVLCPEVAAEQAVEHGVTESAELELLLVHGILHLLGHDHADDSERRAMFALTDRLLADFRAAASP
jgi:probable rRNA maturation factor